MVQFIEQLLTIHIEKAAIKTGREREKDMIKQFKWCEATTKLISQRIVKNEMYYLLIIWITEFRIRYGGMLWL